MNKNCLAIIATLLIFNLLGYGNKGDIRDNYIVNSVMEASNGKIIETSIKAVYYSDQPSMEVLSELKEIINGETIDSNKEKKEVNLLNIVKGDINLEIRGVDLKDKSRITIKATVYNNKKSLAELQQFLEIYTKNKQQEAKYYKYMKGKLSNKMIEEVSLDVRSSLDKLGFSKVETLRIDNGITSVAFLNNDFLEDEKKINYSLCSYGSDTYIFIGTPIIDEIY